MKLLYLFFVIVGLIAFAGTILIIYEVTKTSGLDIRTGDQDRFLNEAEATRIIQDAYPYTENERSEPQFGYLKYENGSKHSWYSADPESAKSGELYHDNITLFSVPEGTMIEKDRYVWTVMRPGAASAEFVFLDAESGEILGRWSVCPGCICHHGGVLKQGVYPNSGF